MIYLFLFNCYVSFLTSVLSRLKGMSINDPEIIDSSVTLTTIAVSVHTLINLVCLDGFQYIFSQHSYVVALLSNDSRMLYILMLVGVLVAIGSFLSKSLEKNRCRFPWWWRTIFEPIPFLIKIILFFGLIIGPFKILGYLIHEYVFLMR